MFFFDTCNAVAAREDRKPKYWRLGRRHLGLSSSIIYYIIYLALIITLQVPNGFITAMGALYGFITGIGAIYGL